MSSLKNSSKKPDDKKKVYFNRPKLFLFSKRVKKDNRNSRQFFTEYLVYWANGWVTWETSKMLCQNFHSYHRLRSKFNRHYWRFNNWLDEDFTVSNAFTCINMLRKRLNDPSHLDQLPFIKTLKKLEKQRDLNSHGKKYFIYNVIQYLKSQFHFIRTAEKCRPQKYLRLSRITSVNSVQASIDKVRKNSSES